MNNDWALLPMRSSNALLGDAVALRRRLARDGYLYLQKVLDPERVLDLRGRVLRVLAEHGWVHGGEWLMEAVAAGRPLHEDQEGFFAAYDALQRLEGFHALAHAEELLAIVRQLVGATAFPHPLKVARLVFPAHYEVTTPPHQDFPNNQGTERLLTAWIPLGDCPKSLGPLAVLRGSHRFGVLPLAPHPGPGKRQALVPPEMSETLRWVTSDFAHGDVVFFSAFSVHAALHNASELHLRLSADFRYQEEGEELTEPCLQPHFQRQTWEEIYAGWSSDRLQYYWKQLAYRVVPFRAYPLRDAQDPGLGDLGRAPLENALRDAIDDGAVQLTQKEWEEILRVDARRQARYQRRLERVSELMAKRSGAPGDAGKRR